MKKLFIWAMLHALTICCFSQEPFYTIYLVNDSRTATIEVGKAKEAKGYGDTILESDCRIWWKENDPNQSIIASYSVDGKTYTFKSEKYVKTGGEWKDQYAYLKYLRTNTTAGKGVNDGCYSEKPAFMSHGIIRVDGLTHFDGRKYILQYCDKDFNVIEIEPTSYSDDAVFFTREQFEEHKIDLSDPNIYFTLIDNKNRTIINYLTIVKLR